MKHTACPIQQTIRKFLEENQIPDSAGFIIAVSGGADSMTLLHAFKYLNLRILALHCNFRLRGKESDMDEQFVKRFCDSYGIALSVKRFNTTDYAAQYHISIEMAARELRYAWFREMKARKKMDYIVTGHQADDLAETVFINLCRGTGIKGLTGIKPVNGDILRPLLSCSRADTEHYIEAHQLGYRTDSSNNSPDYLRNVVRHRIIPVCKEMNPSFLTTIQENCKALKETEALFGYAVRQLRREIIEEKNGEILIHIAKTLATPAPYTLLFEWLHPLGFSKTQIQDILNSSQSTPGKQFQAGAYLLTKGRTYWRLFQPAMPVEEILLIEKEGEFRINEHCRLQVEILPFTATFSIPSAPNVACLDADKAGFPLEIRHWQKGDRFCPIGMNKLQKKVSDFFTDLKFSPKQKNECLLLLTEKKIAWIMGYRLDERFKITSSTRHILRISMKKEA